MTGNQSFRGKLAELLSKECQALTGLLNILHEERDALEARDIDRVAALAKTKQEAVNHIEQLTRARLPLWRTYENIAHSYADIDRQWKQLQSLAKQCFRENEVNGQIILASRFSVERSLRLIRSQSGDPAMTYSSKGQPNAQAPSLRAVKV